MLVKKFAVLVFISILSYLTYAIFFVKPVAQQINVQLLWQDSKLACHSIIEPEGHDKAWSIEQFQFFLSNIEVMSSDAKWHQLRLIKNTYQDENVVLLGMNCRERKQKNDTEALGNWSITVDDKVALTSMQKLRFTLGVPFEKNHLNPIVQASPLNLSSMFWVWQTGHKFLRSELSSEDEQWLFHLGSTGCKAPSVMRTPKTPCRYPNTFDVEVALANDIGEQLTLQVNLARLLENVKLASASNCQSEHDNSSCQQLFENLAAYNTKAESLENNGVFKAIKVSKLNKGTDIE
jgi:uncharacterized repeat protein (TIGR04052 family)